MKNCIEVRPLCRGQESLWVSLGVEESRRETQRVALAKSMAENAFLAPENRLVAIASGRLLGKLSGIRESGGYIATKMILVECPERDAVAAALFGFVRPFGGLQALSWADREDDREWRQLLSQHGFTVRQDKSYFRRKIEGYASPYFSSLTYKSMSELGTGKMLELFGQIYEGSSSRDFSNPCEDFESHRESAGHLFDPASWLVAHAGLEPVGVLLPQRFPDSPKEGTMMSIGVFPMHRKRGFAKILHAKGLEILREQGASDYIGSTDVQNLAMLRVFESNGCRKIGTRTTHASVV